MLSPGAVKGPQGTATAARLPYMITAYGEDHVSC
jgi:hypothetical protein